jgi:hypothetical protein
MKRPLALLALFSTLVGCHHARGLGFIRDSLPPGRPSFTLGGPEGYWIWKDHQGWHLRTTSDAPRHFQGEIEMVGAAPSAVQAVGKAAGGVRREGDDIEFDYQAAGGEQGFDWTSSSGCGRFELYIDGTTRPLRVFLGGVEASPARVPFAVCG